jgi:hypothetical protein
MARALTVGFVLAAIVVACGTTGSSGTSNEGRGGAGDICLDYTSCGAGLYCLVVGAPVEGHCEALPQSCASGDCACLEDALTATCSGKGRCSTRVGRFLLACPTTERKKEGEDCTVARGCEGGLYCKVSTVTRKGKCEKLPAACGTSATCECLKAGGCPGQDVRECAVFGDDASVVCE